MMSSRTHVPAQLLGYLLQVRHMMCELISLDPERIVSVEALDDVAVETRGGIIAEQIKSVQSENNPIANRSEVFWKTMHNWLEYTRDGSLPLNNTVFRMVIIANKSLVAGDIIKALFDAKSVVEAESALLFAKQSLWGEDGIKKNVIPESYATYLEDVFNEANKENIIAIIKGMELEVHADDYDIQLYEKFCAQPIDDRFQERLFLTMLGWVHEKANSFLKLSKAPYLKSKEFRDELVTQLKACNENALLAAASVNPTPAETEGELEKQDVYIKQLGFIYFDINTKLTAASDFLQTRTTKIEWAERGIVNQQNIDNYNKSLLRRWNTHRMVAELSRGQSSIEVGKRLFINCQLDASERIQGGDPPEFFKSGSLHALANEPTNEPQIGWHPQYKTLLKEQEKKDE